jgi:ferredoxin
MKIYVDPERCRGHAQCEDVLPEVFRMNDAHRALVDVINDSPSEDLRKKVELAVRLCPENAISVEG